RLGRPIGGRSWRRPEGQRKAERRCDQGRVAHVAFSPWLPRQGQRSRIARVRASGRMLRVLSRAPVPSTVAFMDAITKPKRSATRAAAREAPRPYPDLHDHVRALDQAGLLIRVDREINKDTEMHPLVRWQFRGGIAERDRKAYLFANVVDSKGR